jgi:hypothetical protein
VDFDGVRFQSKKELIGGGDVPWSDFRHQFTYRIFSGKFLDSKLCQITLMTSKTEVYGE